jgi:hypothetical protein
LQWLSGALEVKGFDQMNAGCLLRCAMVGMVGNVVMRCWDCFYIWLSLLFGVTIVAWWWPGAYDERLPKKVVMV